MTNAVVLSLSLDPNNSNTLYAGTNGGGVFKSGDMGGNWIAINNGLTNTVVDALVLDPSNSNILYAGTSGGGVFKSSDMGANWNAINDGLASTSVRALALDPNNSNTIYAGTLFGGMFRSTDIGGNWIAINNGLTNADVLALALDPSNSNILYAGTHGGGVFKITFSGGTLVFDEPTDVGSDVQVDFGNGVALTFQEVTSAGVTTQVLSPSGPTLPSGFQVATDPPVYYDISTTAAFTGAITVAINYDETQLGGVVEQDLRLLHEEAGTFVDITSGLNTVANTITGQTNDLSFFVVAAPILGELSVLGNVTYCPTDGVVPGVDLALDGASQETVQTAGSGMYTFENLISGETYTITTTKTDDINPFTVSCFDAALIAQHAIGATTLPTCGIKAADVDEDGQLLVFDAALTCRFAIGLPPFGPDDHAGEWRFAPADRSYSPLVADQTAQDFTAILLGDVDGNWTPANPGVSALAKGGANRLGFAEKTEWSEDGTAITTSLHFDGSVQALSFDLEFTYDPEALKYVEAIQAPEGWEVFVNNQKAGHLRLGMFSTTPLAKTGDFVSLNWQVLRPGATTDLVVERASVNDEPQRLPALTTKLERPAPKEFTLHQNYPNPFNPETTIRYELPEASDVRLTIYNLVGQEIRRLVDDRKEAGFHTIVWDGKDSMGRQVASGIYLYRIEAGQFSSVRKLTLLR